MPETITPEDALDRIGRGALLVDIRDADEHRREHIAGARHQPLSDLDRPLPDDVEAVIFHCRSGARTAANAARLKALAGDREILLLEGGLEAWKRSGLPTRADRRQPIEIMRQVQIAAGSLVLLGAVLAWTIDPAFLALSAAVGGGLAFAGISGSCLMARILRRMPWNRVSAAG
jgi:rhodanese-related sulfurtransferase